LSALQPMRMHARCMGRFGSEPDRRRSERKRKAPDGAFDRKPNGGAAIVVRAVGVGLSFHFKCLYEVRADKVPLKLNGYFHRYPHLNRLPFASSSRSTRRRADAHPCAP
jgi:hypothetical protein